MTDLEGPPAPVEEAEPKQERLVNKEMTGAQARLLFDGEIPPPETPADILREALTKAQPERSEKTRNASRNERDEHWKNKVDADGNVLSKEEQMKEWRKDMNEFLDHYKEHGTAEEKRFFDSIDINVETTDAAQIYETFMRQMQGDVEQYAQLIADKNNEDQIENNSAIIKGLGGMYGKDSAQIAELLTGGLKNTKTDEKAKAFIESANENINKGNDGKEILDNLNRHNDRWKEKQAKAQPEPPKPETATGEPSTDTEDDVYESEEGKTITGKDGKEYTVVSDKQGEPVILENEEGGLITGADAEKIFEESTPKEPKPAGGDNLPIGTFKTGEVAPSQEQTNQPVEPEGESTQMGFEINQKFVSKDEAGTDHTIEITDIDKNTGEVIFKQPNGEEKKHSLESFKALLQEENFKLQTNQAEQAPTPSPQEPKTEAEPKIDTEEHKDETTSTFEIGKEYVDPNNTEDKFKILATNETNGTVTVRTRAGEDIWKKENVEAHINGGWRKISQPVLNDIAQNASEPAGNTEPTKENEQETNSNETTPEPAKEPEEKKTDDRLHVGQRLTYMDLPGKIEELRDGMIKVILDNGHDFRVTQEDALMENSRFTLETDPTASAKQTEGTVESTPLTPEEIADKLLDYDTGQVKPDAQIDLRPSWEGLVKKVAEQIQIHPELFPKDKPVYILSDVATMMMHKIADAANRRGVEFAFALQGINLPGDIHIVAYASPASDYENPRGTTVDTDPAIHAERARKLAEQTNLSEEFKAAGFGDTGDATAMLHVHHEGLAPMYHGTPSDQDLRVGERGVTGEERDGKRRPDIGIVTKAGGEFNINIIKSKRMPDGSVEHQQGVPLLFETQLK